VGSDPIGPGAPVRFRRLVLNRPVFLPLGTCLVESGQRPDPMVECAPAAERRIERAAGRQRDPQPPRAISACGNAGSRCFRDPCSLDIDTWFVVQSQRLVMSNALRLDVPEIPGAFLPPACDCLGSASCPPNTRPRGRPRTGRGAPGPRCASCGGFRTRCGGAAWWRWKARRSAGSWSSDEVVS